MHQLSNEEFCSPKTSQNRLNEGLFAGIEGLSDTASVILSMACSLFLANSLDTSLYLRGQCLQQCTANYAYKLIGIS